MTTFNLWFKNLALGSQYYWGEGTMYAIGNYLTEYFNSVCKQSKLLKGVTQYDDADFSWEPRAASVGDHELLVYFLPSRSSSIVARFSNDQPDKSGAPFPTGKGVISEVYIDTMEGDADYPRLVANCAFHEMMHNKLDAYVNAGDQVIVDLHVSGGGDLATGDPKKPITSSMRPNQTNINLMAKVLGKVHPQFTDDLSKKSPYP